MRFWARNPGGADKLPYRRARTSSHRFSTTWSLTSRSDPSSHKTSLFQGKQFIAPSNVCIGQDSENPTLFSKKFFHVPGHAMDTQHKGSHPFPCCPWRPDLRTGHTEGSVLSRPSNTHGSGSHRGYSPAAILRHSHFGRYRIFRTPSPQLHHLKELCLT